MGEPGSPAFGQADLTNCERELIQLAGSVQPHGVLLAVREPDFMVQQVSASCMPLLGLTIDQLLGQPLALLGEPLVAEVRRLAATQSLLEPQPLRATLGVGAAARAFEGMVHRHPGGGLIVELERVDERLEGAIGPPAAGLRGGLAETLQRLGAATSVAALCEVAVQSLRELTGYDRVMVYRFDPDGHGQIIAEARAARLESLLGHHYPATDIPQRARELYVRNRVRVLVDVHYTPAPIVPRLDPATGQELDLSLSTLRSMSPLHLQYLKNMGVTATLVVSLVREGRLWGLVACHHDTPRNLRSAMRAAADLLGEVISTRIAAIENATHAQVAVQVRRLEQRLIDATSSEGDWRRALFRHPPALLQPLDATGAVLFCDGELLTAGEVPTPPQVQALIEWIDRACGAQALFHCASVARANAALAALTPIASGVVAVRLAGGRPDFLVWLRKEQLSTVTWAGDPSKPMVANDPLELSPRRSFAAWSEIVRGSAVPWSGAELSLARALGKSLVDLIVQIHAVRLLIAEHQLTQVRTTLRDANQPVVIASAAGRRVTCNDAFFRLAGRVRVDDDGFETLAELFDDPPAVLQLLDRLLTQHQPWRGELVLRGAGGAAVSVPVAVRAEVVPGHDGAVLGGILILSDLTDTRRAAAARRLLEASLARSESGAFADDRAQRAAREPDPVLGAILTHASLAAMDLTDAVGGTAVAPLLEELEASTQRAAALYGRIRAFGGD